jgi:D-amino-acid dehydrogenase
MSRVGREVSVQLIVVGSGVVGAACAYTAAGLGAQVTLVDAAEPGQATAAGAGIICPWTAGVDDPVWYEYGCLAARQYPDLIAQLATGGEPDVSYRRVGALWLPPDDADQTAMIATATRLAARRAGAPEIGEVEILDPGQAAALFPPLRPGAAAVHITGAARVDGRRLAAALIRAAVRRGAQVRTGHAVLEYRTGRVHAIALNDERLPADAVVAATGAWTTSFLAPAGITVRVEPQRGQIAHIGMEPADTSRWPVVLPSATGHYLLAFGDSRVVAGATRETGAGFDVRVTPGGLAEVLANALTVAPGLSDGTLRETRVGLRPAGPDHRPLLGPVAGLDGLVVATGLGASGLTLGPLTGRIAAQLALGQPPSFEPAPFDPLR